jgi:HD-like signal output (HDOD) protein
MIAKNLELWVEYLCDQPIPVFHHTVQSILALCNDDNTTCKQLADTILRDPAFTARVLSIANSSYYNRAATPLTDIRQAVLLIGFERILGICLTVSILDTLVNKSTLRHIVDLLIRAVQTAQLARAVAEQCSLPKPEEVFVAGLLHDFGEIAFWSLTGPSGQDIIKRLEYTRLPARRAQREILGVTFDEITLGLNKKWKLSPLLAHVLLYPHGNDPQIQCVARSRAVIEALGHPDHQWRHELAALAKYTSLGIHECEALVMQQCMDAAQLTRQYFQAA